MIRNVLALWQNASQGRIFISYRREDTQWIAGRLADSLSRYFGDDRVFRDIEGIGGGADFSNVIHDTLGNADAAIILIGARWLNAKDETGERRLDDPGDWVAQEIASALQAGIPVYPVLVDDTAMPTVDALPELLKPLVRFNAINISDNRWDSDVSRLAKIVGLDIPSETERKLQGVNLLISTALMLSVVFTCTTLFRNLVCDIGSDHPIPDWLSWICPAAEPTDTRSCSTDWPLSLAHSGIPFLAIVPGSALLFVFARLIDKTRRPFFVSAAWVGAAGTLLFFILLKDIPEPYEAISMFFGGTVTALLMFALMNISGFRPK